MKKIITYPLSILHYLLMGGLLCVFHPIQWVCIHWIKGNSQRKAVHFLNYLLIKLFYVTGNNIRLKFEAHPPKGVPLIFVPNHQSIYDIPPLIWALRDFDPKFVGKKELDKNIPSIAINLRNDGSVFIDRKNATSAVEVLTNFGKFLRENNASAVIFPEGTRSRNGELKPFKTKGLKTLMEQIPNGYVVPITINNSWKLVKNGAFPLTLGNDFNLLIHKAIAINSDTPENIIEQARSAIAQGLQT